MLAPRRFLPSISSLLALEAVDRLGSATAAAEELALTHSAVSRQLKVLEGQLGVTLLVRDGKSLRLTRAGETYSQSARTILGDLARASLEVKATGSRESINLAILPTFAVNWLTPRLRDFHKAHPEILISQSTRLERFDFEREKFDAAIHFGEKNWSGVNYLPLTGERIIAVCAPDFADDLPLTPARLLNMPLLHLESRPGAWERWFQRLGCDAPRLRGSLFDQYTNLTEAAVSGLGAALLPEFVASKELARGRLIPASGGYVENDGTYYLVWPKSGETSNALKLLIDFLRKPTAALES
ncbi:MAG: LysR substrate-binding domain-containing protein [Maritimibacter sp.]